jgi:hypothetical protein
MVCRCRALVSNMAADQRPYRDHRMQHQTQDLAVAGQQRPGQAGRSHGSVVVAVGFAS